jgi:branched-chain amino acid transport system permease protein
MIEKLVSAVGTGIAQGAMIALVALGYSMVYGILKLINFAHSEVFMMSAFAGFFLLQAFGVQTHPALALAGSIVVAMMMAGALGVVVERTAYAPLRRRGKEVSRIAPLVTALGMSVLLTNLAQLLFSATYRSYPRVMELSSTRTLIIVASFTTMVFLQGLVHYTWFGKSMRALSMNVDAARLMGVRTTRVISLTFMTGSSLAALGSILFCLDQSPAYPTMGTVIGTRAFVAAVIGGIGSIPGAVLGGLLLGVLGELTKLTPYSSLQDVFVFGALVIVLLVKPSGLLGKTGVEKV